MAGVPQQGIAAPIGVPEAAPMPGRTPATFAATAIGEGLDELGGTLARGQAQAKEAAARRQYQVDASAAGVAAAEATSDVSQQIDAIREEAAPGAAGHVDAVGKAIDDRFGQVLSGISNPVLRGQFNEDLARTKARLISDESGWAAGRRIAYQVTNVKTTAQLLGNTSFSHPDAQTFSDGLATLATTIGNQGLSADKAQELLHDQGQELAEARAKGAIQDNPASALELLRGDELTPWLPADRRAALEGEAETQLRIQDADARRQVSHEAALVHVDAESLNGQIAKGDLPSDDAVAAVIGRAQVLEPVDPGLKNVVTNLQYNQGKLKWSRITDKWTSGEWDAHINPLAAKVANGKASDEEQVELNVLQDLRPHKEARIANDPDGTSAANGVPPPVVDLDNPDPKAVDQRKSWARAFAHPYGLAEPPYLNKNQLAEYRGRAAQGSVAALAVATELKQTWGDAAPSIVRQIGGAAAPDMKIMLGLDPSVAQLFSRGNEALHKKVVDVDGTSLDAARVAAAPLLRGVPADLQPALFDAARKIAAGWMLKQGYTKQPANFSDVYLAALQYAAGRGGSARDFNSPGGLAELNGRYAWLPSDMTSNDFLRRVARAQPQDWVNAATDSRGNPVKSHPGYVGPNGKFTPYGAAELARFNKATLQSLDAGLYHLVDPLGHVVVDEHQQLWTFDVRRLPRSHTIGGAR